MIGTNSQLITKHICGKVFGETWLLVLIMVNGIMLIHNQLV